MLSMANDSIDKGTEITSIQLTTDPHTDECSPFCFCSCCSLSVAEHSIRTFASVDIENIAIAMDLIEYSNPYSKAHQNSIWQPPKA
jgi:hypothetical protein